MNVFVPPEITKLEDLIGPGVEAFVEFLGQQPDAESAEVVAACREAFDTVRSGEQHAAKFAAMQPERRRQVVSQHNVAAREIIRKLSAFDEFTMRGGRLALAQRL